MLLFHLLSGTHRKQKKLGYVAEFCLIVVVCGIFTSVALMVLKPRQTGSLRQS